MLNNAPPFFQVHLYYNITIEERKWLRNVSVNKDKIIKEADKGSTVVVMNIDYYKTKIQSVLRTTDTYQNLHLNINKTIIN